MIEFVLTFAILLLIVAGMAVGVMRGRKPISGTCGGLNQLGVDGACEICGGRPELCDENDANMSKIRLRSHPQNSRKINAFPCTPNLHFCD